MVDQSTNYKVIIGKNIQLALRKKGKTQSWLANQLDIYSSQLNKYIKGKSMPNPELFSNIAKALGLTAQQLLSLNDQNIKILSNNDEKEFSLDNEFQVEYQSIIKYTTKLEQSTSDKKIKSLSKLIKNKIIFIIENI